MATTSTIRPITAIRFWEKTSIDIRSMLFGLPTGSPPAIAAAGSGACVGGRNSAEAVM